jgi:dTDP-4-amino-4,6-dideoxygalactose transaminase
VIPFLDLAADFAEGEADARRRLDGVLARQQFVLGPETAELEASLAAFLGAPSAVAVSSGSDALSLALLALGVGPGDAVLVPAFTFFATAGAVARAGAVPVFCDVEAGSANVSEATMREALARFFHGDGDELRHRDTGARLAALMPVHLYGRACAMDGVLRVADDTGARVIEDAAQAIGARTRGKSVGLFGDAGCFSFYPTKNLGGAGDGGLVVAADAALGERVARLRSHGGEHGSYLHHEVGVNARLSELAAAVLNAKLPRLEAWTRRRREIAARYLERLGDAASRGLFDLPETGEAEANVWHQFPVRLAPGAGGRSRRDAVQRALDEQGIATRVFYPLALPFQPCFASLGARPGDFPEAEAAAAERLCLPIHPSLDHDAVDRVAAALVAAARNS